MISAAVWSPQAESWTIEGKLTRSKKTAGALELVRGGVPLICYCTKRHGGSWISVFAKAEEPSDEPYHCPKLPFPFLLPVYPKSALVFVVYKERGQGVGADIPFHLGSRSTGVGAITFEQLTMQRWMDLLTAVNEENEHGDGVYGMLQAAFDAYWQNDETQKDDDDFVADDDVATDLMLLHSAAQAGGGLALGAGAPASSLDASARNDEDWNEEETVVDARTGFVVEKNFVELSDDDETSEEEDSEKEDEEDVDLEDEDEDVEDDMPDLDMQVTNDDS